MKFVFAAVLLPAVAYAIGEAGDTDWPNGASVEVQLRLFATVGANGQVRASGDLLIKNPSDKNLTIQNPRNRLVLAFLVFDPLGNPVAPAGRGKADPGFETQTLSPRATYTHHVEGLDFVTGSAWLSYDLSPGEDVQGGGGLQAGGSARSRIYKSGNQLGNSQMMNNPMPPRLLRSSVLLAAILAAGAVTGQDFQATWRKTRGRQPAGLTLEFKLPKTEFHQGEIIPATLTFKNTSTNRYHLWTGNYDRSGRIPDIAFRAEGENRRAVTDPLAWYFTSQGGEFGGLGSEQDLGQWSITLTANQWLRFEGPGTYRVYAFSSRPRLGTTKERGSGGTGLELVSDFVTVSILPLDVERERKILTDAQTALDTGGEPAAQATATLRYLQTPAARKLLVPLLQRDQSSETIWGLIGAPDPAAEAPSLVELARRPDVAVSSTMIWLYAVLRSYGLKPFDAPEQRGQELREANRLARSEFIAAVRAAVGAKHGEALLTTVLTLLAGTPQDRELRGMLVGHKAELTRRHVLDIVQRWHTLSGDDLLPVLRMAAKPPLASPAALGLLAKVSPDDARPLIIEDLAREKPLYLDPGRGGYAIEPLEALPDRELPELDAVLRAKLHAKHPDFTVMPLIARYASTNLLADVLVVYRRSEGRWACEIQNAALRYWIRCQPKEGVAALARALKSRAETGCYRRTLSEVLMDTWRDEALTVVVEALRDENPEVVQAAVQVLERHAPSGVIPEVIVAIKRLASMRPGDSDQAAMVGSLATLLRDNKRWHLTQEQRAQLAEALPVKKGRNPQ